MARKKSRVPGPPRRVQAPKKRGDPRVPRRARMWLIALGLALAVAAAGVGIALAVSRGGGSAEAVAGACTEQTFPDLNAGRVQTHAEELPEGYEYNSFPPTSGIHHPTPAIYNFYDRPVAQLNALHNLEHGGVNVQYGKNVPLQTVNRIADWYQEDPRGLIVAQLPDDAPARLNDKIVLTAWTHLATCSTFDEGSFDDFLDDFRGPDGDAPEKLPLDALQPGST